MTLNADQVIESLKQIDRRSFETHDQYARAVVAVKDLLARLQTPWDHIHRLTWKEPAYIAALKVATDINLFTSWQASDSDPKTVSELAAMSGVEEALLVRLLRHISAMGALNEVAPDTYTLTSFTESLAGPGNSDSLRLMFEATYPAFLNLPSFLAKNGYRNPINSSDSNWQDLRHSPQTYIEFVGSDTDRTKSFQNLMVAYNKAKGVWTDFYPTTDLIRGIKPDRVVLVDAGGGLGFDIEAFRLKHRQLPNKSLVLQDLPTVIATVQVHDCIKVMPHNLFEPQPVKGARAYFTHIVFHTWTNTDAMKVLHNLAEAMERGYSKLLLHEKIISDRHPTPDTTSMDLTMMAMFSATERTQSIWREMLTAANLKINKVYTSPTLFDAIIEAELA
ncbi:hypothetical protein MMC17_009158 [Xylographa soralifera]|nr:hypothetical protein [Xylographa soralifera]